MTNAHRKSKSGLVLFCYFKFGLATNQTYLMFVRELLKDCREQALTGASMAGLGCILLISYSKLPISMTALLSLYLIKLLFAFSVNHDMTAWSKDYK